MGASEKVGAVFNGGPRRTLRAAIHAAMVERGKADRGAAGRPPLTLTIGEEAWEDVLLDPDPHDAYTILTHRDGEFLGIGVIRERARTDRRVTLRWSDGSETEVELP